jgi:hypothetical protein
MYSSTETVSPIFTKNILDMAMKELSQYDSYVSDGNLTNTSSKSSTITKSSADLIYNIAGNFTI